MNLDKIPNNIDAAPSLKASVFEEVKAESALSRSLTELEAEAELGALEIEKLSGLLAPVLRPDDRVTPAFVGNDSDSPIARIEDVRIFIMRQRHIIQSLAGRVDL